MMSLPQQLKQCMWRVLAAATLATLTTSAQAQMAMPGSFAVSPSGAATYTVPIQVPPGVGGLAPNLALVYNSQGGNGLLGVGWSLSGLSSITRCPRTMAQDGVRGSVNYDLNDRYCLDGQRLIAVKGADGGDGTEYRTEQDEYVRVVSYTVAGVNNGPAFFVAKTKSGLIMEFGQQNPDDDIVKDGPIHARVFATGKGVVAAWALNKVSDIKGKFYTIYYYQDKTTGMYVPDHINYTISSSSNPLVSAAYRVSFPFENRPDKIQAYQAGSGIFQSLRLSQVKILALPNKTVLKNYSLIYDSSSLQVDQSIGASRLRSITECASNQCNIPLTMNYSNGATGFVGVSSNNIGGWGDSNLRNMIADVNGDGKSDIVRIWNTSNGQAQADVLLSNSTDFVQVSNTIIGGWAAQNHVTDVNGDGRADIVRIWQNGSKAQADVLLSNSTGFVQVSNTIIGGWGDATLKNQLADVNGDGRADVVRRPLVVSFGNQQRQSLMVVAPCGHELEAVS
jgi:hypothetical protein